MFGNVMPWQVAAPIGLGLPGQYGQLHGPLIGGQGYPQIGQPYPQLNGVVGQLGLLPLTAACLAAQTAFATVLAQYGQAASAAWPGQPQYGQQSIFGWPGQQQIGLGQLGQLPIGALGFPPQSALGVPGGAFGQRGIGSPLPFLSTPQMSYAG